MKKHHRYTTADDIRRDAALRPPPTEAELARSQQAAIKAYLSFLKWMDNCPVVDPILVGMSGAPLNQKRAVQIREWRVDAAEDFIRIFDERSTGTGVTLFPYRDPEFRKGAIGSRGTIDPARTFAISSDESWFRALSVFDREYVAFRFFFAPRLPAFSDSSATADRLLLSAATRRTPDLDDDGFEASEKYLNEFEQWLNRPLHELPSLADLDPVLFRMAAHHLRVADDFKQSLSKRWAGSKLDKRIAALDSCGPLGRSAAEKARAGVEAHAGFMDRFRSETVVFHRKIATQACERLASRSFAIALERNRNRRDPALTLRGLQRVLLVRVAADLMALRFSQSEATRRANELLSHVLGAPWGGEISRFARQSVDRWVKSQTAES